MSLKVKTTAELYFEQVARLMQAVDLDALQRVIDRLQEARQRDSAVFIMGNGGSAATCSHFANDLASAARFSSGRPLRVFSLTDSSTALTCLSNDEGYDRVFLSQLENWLRPRDLLIAISASGNSLNLVKAVEYGRENGAVSIGFLGFDGGRLRDMVDEPLVVSSPIGAYGPVEDVHLVLQHVVKECLMQQLSCTGQAQPRLEECAVS